MRRSEAVEKIAEKLLDLHGGDQEERNAVRIVTKMSRLISANKALQAMEEAGMTPPRIRHQDEACWEDEDN